MSCLFRNGSGHELIAGTHDLIVLLDGLNKQESPSVGFSSSWASKDLWKFARAYGLVKTF